jgi:hypothetical protein
VNVTYRPIGTDWPGKRRTGRERKGYTFKASWSSTLSLLDRELRALEATEVIFQVDLRESDIRLDGMPRADAKVNDAAVIVSFQSKYGPLRYYCDFASQWQHNVRAISLGLEHLRLVDRYGITTRGEQYAGWRALGTGSGEASGVVYQFSGPDEAARFILGKALGADPNDQQVRTVIELSEYRDEIWRRAAKRCHPDTGGNRADWDTLSEARRILETAAA